MSDMYMLGVCLSPLTVCLMISRRGALHPAIAIWWTSCWHGRDSTKKVVHRSGRYQYIHAPYRRSLSTEPAGRCQLLKANCGSFDDADNAVPRASSRAEPSLQYHIVSV